MSNKKIKIVIAKNNCLQKSICHGFCVSNDFTIKPPKLTKKTPIKIIKLPKIFLFIKNYIYPLNKEGKKRTISGYKTKIVTAKICKKIKGITPLNMSKRDIFGGATLLM